MKRRNLLTFLSTGAPEFGIYASHSPGKETNTSQFFRHVPHLPSPMLKLY